MINRLAFLTVIFCLALPSVNAQENVALIDPYEVNLKVEIPAATVGVAAVIVGFGILKPRTTLTENYVLQLSAQDINRFDRSVLSVPQSGYEKARTTSDVMLNVSVAAPILLLLDKKIRKNWLDIGIMYAEAHAVSGGVYHLSAFSIKRARPMVYNPDVSLKVRTGFNASNSFFSGHTSSTAASTFFMAKVIADTRELTALQKVFLYGAASIPPALVAHYRIKGGKHFRTDVAMGYLVGALSGILVPHLHKKKKRDLSFIPVYNDNLKGFALNYKLN